MSSFLVRFTYDYYCQGYEDAVETVLVKNVFTFEQACGKIGLRYKNAREFENLTIE